MKSNVIISIWLLFCILSTLHNLVYSQWSHTADSNLVISSIPNSQRNPTLVSDGSGGAILVWSDFHTDFWKYDIYTQRINGNGVLQWEKDGIPMCIAVYEQSVPEVLSDGMGGAVVAWVDKRNGSHENIFAQRVGNSGSMLWQENGIPICMAPGWQGKLQILGSNDGSYVIAWIDGRAFDTTKLYAQKIDNTGAIHWLLNGSMISHTQYLGHPLVVDDGRGGAIFIWQDWRNGSIDFNLADIYAQRIDSAGFVKWGDADLKVVGGEHGQEPVSAIDDGVGGALVVWQEADPNFKGLRIQRIDNLGAIVWGEKGITLDSLGLAYSVLFRDNFNSDSITVYWLRGENHPVSMYSQLIDMQGNFQWETGGREIYQFSVEVSGVKIIRDASKNLFISWLEWSNSSFSIIKIQKIDAMGLTRWPAKGITVSNSNIDNVDVRMISDGDEGVIVTWYDSTNGTNDIFAQRINKDGNLGAITGINEENTKLPTLYVLHQNYPNPFNPSTTITYQLPIKSFVTISVFNMLGEKIATLINELQEAGIKTVQFDTGKLSSGMYFYRLNVGMYSDTKKMVLLK